MVNKILIMGRPKSKMVALNSDCDYFKELHAQNHVIWVYFIEFFQSFSFNLSMTKRVISTAFSFVNSCILINTSISFPGDSNHGAGNRYDRPLHPAGWGPTHNHNHRRERGTTGKSTSHTHIQHPYCPWFGFFSAFSAPSVAGSAIHFQHGAIIRQVISTRRVVFLDASP